MKPDPSNNVLTNNKTVLPGHTYSHKEGDDSNPRFYYTDPQGNLTRYTNAPAGHPDFDGQHPDASPHHNEPLFETHPEYFTPDGRKLNRAADVDPTQIEWNTNYNAFDPKNLWAGKWASPDTGTDQHIYIDADLKNFPKLNVHQQNALVDAQLPQLRQYESDLFHSDKIKDQMTAIALILLDQGRMRATALAVLTSSNVSIDGSQVTIGTRQFIADDKIVSAFNILKRFKTPDEPLFTVPLQKQDGSVDEKVHRFIGPNYLAAVLDTQGLSLLGLQTYHSTIRFAKEVSKLMYEYSASWDIAMRQGVIAVAYDWGHDLSKEYDQENILKLTQAVLVDPVVIDALQQKAKEAKLEEFDCALPLPTTPVYYLSTELTDRTSDESTFSQWLHSIALHEYASE